MSTTSLLLKKKNMKCLRCRKCTKYMSTRVVCVLPFTNIDVHMCVKCTYKYANIYIEGTIVT